jgi:hypothetical protein
LHSVFNPFCSKFGDLDHFMRFYKFVITLKVRVWSQSNHRPTNHTRDPKIVAVVDRWALFRITFMFQTRKGRALKQWSLYAGGRYSEVFVSSGLTVFHLINSLFNVSFLTFQHSVLYYFGIQFFYRRKKYSCLSWRATKFFFIISKSVVGNFTIQSGT